MPVTVWVMRICCPWPPERLAYKPSGHGRDVVGDLWDLGDLGDSPCHGLGPSFAYLDAVEAGTPGTDAVLQCRADVIARKANVEQREATSVSRPSMCLALICGVSKPRGQSSNVRSSQLELPPADTLPPSTMLRPPSSAPAGPIFVARRAPGDVDASLRSTSRTLLDGC